MVKKSSYRAGTLQMLFQIHSDHCAFDSNLGLLTGDDPIWIVKHFFHFKFWRANVFSKLTFMFCVGFITSCIIVHCLIMIGPNLVQSQHKSLQMPFFFLTWWTHNLNFRALFSSLASHISKWIHSIETVVINSGFFAHSELKMES